MKKATYIIVALLCILIGLYPLLYLLLDQKFIVENKIGLLSMKPTELLDNILWNIAFYGHIIFGGIALLIGWLQFSKKLRLKNLKLHRIVGKSYVICVLLSGLCGIYIAFFATGGLMSTLGFLSLDLIWLTTTVMAFRTVKNGDIISHKKLMIYSYAACFAAVTLRIWLPLLVIAFKGFTEAYRIVAWLCWIPNILVAYIINRNIESNEKYNIT